MLEKFAISLLNQSEAVLMAAGIGVSIVGFILALLKRQGSTWSLRRVPYFLALAGTFVVSSALPLAWLATFEAMQAGILWLLVAAVFTGIAALGYAYGVISHARSVSGYGDGSSAWMGFVPIANLFLLFKTPMQDASKRSLVGVLGNVGGIIFGLFLLALGQVITQTGDRAINDAAERAGSDPALQSLSIEAMIDTQGLRSTLSQMAAEVPSQRVDETKTLVRVEGDGDTLRYIYRVETNALELPASVRTGLTKHNCGYEGISAVIQAGATVEHVYRRSDETELGIVTIDREVCAAPEPEPQAQLQPTEAEITAMIEASPAGEMYRALKGYYPSEAEYFRTSITTLLNGGPSEEEAFSKMLTVGAEIRRRHAGNLRTAPDQSLVAILLSQTQMIAAFDDNPELCNRVIMFGAGAIPEEDRPRVVALLDSASLLYRAMYEGEQSPSQRTPATDDDWGKLIAEFYVAGGTDDELDLVMQPDMQNQLLCSSMLRFLRVLTDSSFTGSDRLRAEMVAEMNEG
jgi:hypothetical protein